MATILGFRTSSYALQIYVYGSNRLTTRDGFAGPAAGYFTPIEQYGANNFDKATIDNALAMTWITEQEYAQTVALIKA
jgi:hypothetical protein